MMMAGKRLHQKAQPLVWPLLLLLVACLVLSQWRAQPSALHLVLPEDSVDKVSSAPSTSNVLRSSWALSSSPRQPPQYSTHTCIGQKFDDNWHQATCKFDSVCLNASTREFEYYLDPEFPDNPVAYDQSGHAFWEFSPHLVNPGHAHVDLSIGWRPVVKRRGFPEEGERVKWAPAPQALIQTIPAKLVHNFGHVMYDVLVPLFNMQHLFGIYTPDAQILIPFASQGTDAELREGLGRLINTPHPEDSLLHLSWNSDAAWLGEYAERVLGDDGDGLVCFQTLLAGTGLLNRQLAGVDSLPYREAVVRHIGLEETPQDAPVITILNKQGRRMLENWEQIAAVLQARFPLARVNMFDFGSHPNMTMAEQVKLMSDTTILISPCGGLATVLTFLRPGSTALVMNYWHTLKGRSLHLEDNYYRHIEYLDIQYFPVTTADYGATRDRPGCELSEDGGRPQDAHYPLLGSLVHCNLRIEGEGMQRMVHYVDNAMLRWAAREGRYDAVASIKQQVQQQKPAAAGKSSSSSRKGRRKGGTSSKKKVQW